MIPSHAVSHSWLIAHVVTAALGGAGRTALPTLVGALSSAAGWRLGVGSRIRSWVRAVLARYDLKVTHAREDTWPPDFGLFEAIVAWVFRDAPPRYLVQVGANDGRKDDPVRALVQRYSMMGLVIEPLPDAFRRLVGTYAAMPSIVPINAAITDRDGTQRIYRAAAPPGAPEDLSVLASFNRGVIAKHRRQLCSAGARIVAEDVATMTARTLLAAHPVPRIDILQVDAEGDDAKIVRQFLDAGARPAVIQYEHRHLSGREDADCRRLLREGGYLLARLGTDTVAVRSGDLPDAP